MNMPMSKEERVARWMASVKKAKQIKESRVDYYFTSIFLLRLGFCSSFTMFLLFAGCLALFGWNILEAIGSWSHCLLIVW